MPFERRLANRAGQPAAGRRSRAPGSPTRRTACACSARRRCARCRCRRVATRPRAGICGRCSRRAVRSAPSRSRRSTTASRAASGRWRTRRGSQRRYRGDRRAGPPARAARRTRWRFCARGRHGSRRCCSPPSRSGSRCRSSSRSTTRLFLARRTGWATGPSGSTRRSTRTRATTSFSSLTTLVAGAVFLRRPALRAGRCARRGAGRVPRRRHDRGHQAVRRARPAGGGPGRPGAALGRPQLGPSRLVPVRPSDRDRRDGRGGRRRPSRPAQAVARLCRHDRVHPCALRRPLPDRRARGRGDGLRAWAVRRTPDGERTAASGSAGVRRRARAPAANPVARGDEARRLRRSRTPATRS